MPGAGCKTPLRAAKYELSERPLLTAWCHACKKKKKKLLLYQTTRGSGHETICCNPHSIKQSPQSQRLPLKFPGFSRMTCVALRVKRHQHSQLGRNTLLYFNSTPVCLCRCRQPLLLCKSGELRNDVTHFGMQKAHMYLFTQRNTHSP